MSNPEGGTAAQNVALGMSESVSEGSGDTEGRDLDAPCGDEGCDKTLLQHIDAAWGPTSVLLEHFGIDWLDGPLEDALAAVVAEARRGAEGEASVEGASRPCPAKVDTPAGVEPCVLVVHTDAWPHITKFGMDEWVRTIEGNASDWRPVWAGAEGNGS